MIRLSDRASVPALLLLALALAGCESPPDALEGALTFSVAHNFVQSGLSDQVNPRFDVRVPPGVPAAEVESVRSMRVHWPDGAHSELMAPRFEIDDAGGFRGKLEPTVLREPLPEGVYSYEVFGLNLQLRFEGSFEVSNVTLLDPVLPREHRIREDGIEFAWTGPAQPHEWTLSLHRTSPEPVVEVGESSSGTSVDGANDFDISVTGIEWDESARYELVLELVNENNFRVFRMPFFPPDA